MKISKKLASLGFIFAFANLIANSALANENAREIQGEFIKVKMTFVRAGEYPFFNYNQVLSDYRAEINQRAMEVCHGRDFAIDTRSISFEREGGPFLPPPVLVYGAKVLAFCEF